MTATLRITCTDLARLALAEMERRAAEAELGRLSFADFARFAIAAGVVDGIKRVQWGKHLDRFCTSLQFQLEGWLVSHGPDRDSDEWPAWAAEHAHMIERQRAAWEREWPVEVAEGEAPRSERATWEDGEPEPWLRYVLVQNELDNLPPGTLKSTLAMVLANAWIWLWDPSFAFGAASGIDANVNRDSKATRDLVKSRWYRETFQIVWHDENLEDDSTREAKQLEVKRDSDAVSDWATSAGGKRRSRTISSGFTGTHVDCTFVDDPDDADKVYSEAERVKPQNRWTRAIEDRVNCEHRSIRRVMQQRVHVEDFSAYLLSFGQWSPRNPKGWVWFCIAAEYGYQPAEAPAETPYGPVDWRTTKGDLMHPRLSAGVLADKRGKRPAYEGPYNQNPDRAANGDFERRLARFFVFEGENPAVMRRRPDGCMQRVGESAQPPVVIRLADLDRVTLSVDAANSLDPKPGAKVSAVGLLVGGCRVNERYVLDDRTRVLGVAGTYRAIYEILAAWRLDTMLVEVKALGNAVIQRIEESIKRGFYRDDNDRKIELLGPDGLKVRCKVEPFNPGTDSKAQRAHGALTPWQDGEIFLHDGAPWLFSQVDGDRKTLDDGFIGEICGWPKARRNDRMDTLSQWIAHNRGKSDARSRWKAMGRT